MVEARDGSRTPWVLFDQPRKLSLDKDLGYELRVAFVTKGDRNWDEELQLADTLYNRYLPGLPYGEAFQTFLNLFNTININYSPLRKESPGRSVNVLSALTSHIIEGLCIEYAQGVPNSYLSRLKEQASSLEGTRDPNNQWFFTYLNALTIHLEKWQRTYRWIDQLKTRLDTALINVETEEIVTSEKEIWKKLTEERGYGVKSCYFNSPLFLDDKDVFYMLDQRLGGIEDPKVLQLFQPDIMAVIGIGSRPTQSLTPATIDLEYKTSVGQTLIGLSGTKEISGLFPIDQSGEVRTGVFSHTPLRRAFERKGAIKGFEFWRLFMFMRLYDLTHRADFVDRVSSMGRFEEEAMRGSRGLFGLGPNKVRKMPDYKTLVLPRTKPLEPEPREELIEERRFVDRHHVTWFVRILPSGYHATERAKLYAKEHGVNLQDYETIVREHWRGQDREKDLSSNNKPTRALFRRS